MTQPHNPTSTQIVIAGGGVAALEALIGLRSLLGDRPALTLVSQGDTFVDRPMTVAEPFGLGSASRYSLPDLAAELGTEFVQATVTAVDAAQHTIRCADGPEISFDALILALGARPTAPLPDAITFGTVGSSAAIADMLARIRRGEGRSVAFVAPSMTGWLLPLYELALMTARDLVRHHVEGVRLSLVTYETRPLAMFGEEGSGIVARLLGAAGIDFVGAAAGTHEVMAGVSAHPSIGDYLVTLPILRGPAIYGVPTTQVQGFIPVDEYGRVEGLADVYAAGDAVNFPIKQGGLAAQMADTVVEHIAAQYGADVEPSPFHPVLRGMLFTGDDPQYMRSAVPSDGESAGAWYPLWWPPTKVAGRYLPPYLFARGGEDELGGPPMGFIDVDMPLAALTLAG